MEQISYIKGAKIAGIAFGYVSVDKVATSTQD